VKDRGLDPRPVKKKTIKLVFVAFPPIRSIKEKTQNWLDRNQDNMSGGSGMSILGRLCQWAGTKKIQLSV